MNNETFFLDTYAIFEITKGNPKFSEYSKANGITTIFNIAEFNHALKKEMEIETANEITDRFIPIVVDVSFDEIKKAMDLKIRNKELSIPDAVGYTVAKKHHLKFLTGDKEFEKMPNVEFVKK